LPIVVSTARKLELLSGVIADADAAGATSKTTREWYEKVLAVLRATMGHDHPTIASANKARFSPILITSNTTDQDFDNARRSGVGKVVAVLKGAIAEVEATQEEVSMPMSDTSSGNSTIFLVHGHAEGRKFEVARFIEQETGEWPVILHEQADQSQTIIEKLERHGSAAGFAVVLLTADDEGKALDAAAPSARARQNVVFEHGYFIGKLGRKRVVALYEDGVELPSDLSGILYKKLSGNWKSDLLTELRAAGLTPTGTAGPPAAGQAGPARPVGSDHEAVSLADVKTGLANGGPAYTATWRHTSEGMDAVGAMNSLQKRLSHPGYGARVSGTEPPIVRFGLFVACDPLGENPSASALRAAFLAFLDRPPVRSLLGQLTAIPSDVSWSNYDGNGRLMLGAVLGDTKQETSAPIASAVLNLHDNQATRTRDYRRCAELILAVEPRDTAGVPASPVSLARWHERLVTALELPTAFAGFLSEEVDVETYDEPAVQFGVCLEAQPSVGALIDTASFERVLGSVATSHFPSYFIAERGGRRPAQAAIDMLKTWCDHALHLDGYEGALSGLS
jgi:predicted nucleotide-binding protein